MASEKIELPSHPVVWWSRVKLRWPLLIWIVAALTALGLYFHGGSAGALQGVVEAGHEVVAPLVTARLAVCHVEVGQRVAAGDLLVELDADLVDAELAVTRLRIKRQFDLAVRRAESELRTLRQNQILESAELAVLDDELTRMNEMVRQRLMDVHETVRFRTRHRVLSESLAGYPRHIVELEDALVALREQRAAIATGLTGSDFPAPTVTEISGEDELDDDLQVLGGSYGWLNLRREEYMLRARNDGVVVRVHTLAGNTVRPGEPLVTLLLDRPPRVIGFVPERMPYSIATGQYVGLVPLFGGASSSGQIVAVAPEYRMAPDAVRQSNLSEMRGRWFVVEVDDNNGLLPGQAVNIFPVRQRWLPTWMHNRFTGREKP